MEYLLFLVLVFYLVPWVVAEAREHRDATRILCFNLLLGWTGLGWLAAWLWARHTPAPAPQPVLRLIANPDAECTPPRSTLSACAAPGRPPGARRSASRGCG